MLLVLLQLLIKMKKLPKCAECGQPIATYSEFTEEETGRSAGNWYHPFCYITKGHDSENSEFKRRTGCYWVPAKKKHHVLTVRVPSGGIRQPVQKRVRYL